MSECVREGWGGRIGKEGVEIRYMVPLVLGSFLINMLYNSRSFLSLT